MSDNDSVAVVVIEYEYVVGPTIRLNWESASDVTEGVASWLFGMENRCVDRVSSCGDVSWWCLFGEWFVATLSLLVEMAFGGGNGQLQVASNDLGCKIGPGDEKISFGCLEESADTGTAGSGVEPLSKVPLCLFGKQCIGLWLVGIAG